MSKTPIPLTHGKDTLLEPVARLNGHVFDTDPVVTYMLLEMSEEERLAYLPTYWSTLVKSALLNDAIITEADGWKAASVLVPPGKYIDNAWKLLYAGFLSVLWRIGFSGLKERLWTEFSGMTDNAKKKGLHGQKLYYYIFSIGTEHEHRGKGLAKAIMRQHQKTARAEDVPIWLEATSPSSRDLYLSLGFQEIEEIILGKGKVNADATRQSGGSGVPLYAMVWWPKGTNAAL
ncbi:Acyl-CoA N-acyltransferase [Penicillium malachiteum]|uniref:Acyl-CoA N-acyltransferase n=1 Tax=Penicillium malachiteum TaxID=1324776 RepID=UPI002547E11A|nr:Acyl-CoA N-acyltransferase [Penicillium malachiteum]KAJ5735982.1 Acyl-CoA N-acyltransferase [Penicillium malachiteum]